MPFSYEIMGAVVPPGLVGVKASFTGVEDPEALLTAFHTQMMLSGGSDAVYCKLFMSTLSGIALEWFVSLPDGHITSFQQFSKLFREQYIVNRAPPVVSYDLFDVRQNQGDSLQDYLSRFGAQVVRQTSKDEDMLVHAFKKGVPTGPFSECLIRHRPSTFAEIRRRDVAHITVETAVSEKRESAVPNKSRAGPSRTQQPMRAHEAKEGKRAQGKPRPYKPRRDQNGGARGRVTHPPGLILWWSWRN